MKKRLLLFLLLLSGLHFSARTFYDQLCSINSNWKGNSFFVPVYENKNFSSDKEFIQAHLLTVEKLLRLKNVNELSANQQLARKKNLDILHEYILAGNFPKNYYKSFRTPVFIDEHGTHCAVGYLMMRTGHDDLAQRISSNDNYVFVKKIDDAELPDWQQASGFSVEELALIQPSYGVIYSPTITLQEPSCGTRYFEDAGGQPYNYVWVWNFSDGSTPKPPVKHIWCKGECKNGVLNGKWIQNSSPNIPWVKGEFVNGKKSGTWTVYFSGTKKINKIEHWLNGKLNGLFDSLDYNGKHAAIGNFVNGIKDGEWKTWQDGYLITQCNYVNGKLNGESFSYYYNYSDTVKRIFKHCSYVNDVLQSIKVYSQAGILCSEKKFIGDGIYESAEYTNEGKLCMQGNEKFSLKKDSSLIAINLPSGSRVVTMREAYDKIGMWNIYPPLYGYVSYNVGDSCRVNFENDSVRSFVRFSPNKMKGEKDSVVYDIPLFWYTQEQYWLSGKSRYDIQERAMEIWVWQNAQLTFYYDYWQNGRMKSLTEFRDGKLLNQYYYDNTSQPMESWTTQMISGNKTMVYTKNDLQGRILMKGPMKDSVTRDGMWEFHDYSVGISGSGKYENNLKVGYWLELSDDKAMACDGFYVNNVKEGKWREVNIKTQEYAIGNYEQGKKIGKWKFYTAKRKFDHKEKYR
jgi:antitoxin component YwqK of YwqJK toxin-antitoxin module